LKQIAIFHPDDAISEAEAYGLPADLIESIREAGTVKIATVIGTLETDLNKLATGVPGLLGDVADWIYATSFKPNRTLSLASSIALIGMLICRRVQTPMNGGTVLYVVGVAPTGSGKERPQDAVMQILKKIDCSNHIGPGSFMSSSALVNMLDTKPMCLCFQDEFGAVLKKTNDRNAKGFEKEVNQCLRQLWSKGYGTYVSPRWAGKDETHVDVPSISILGMTTPEEFYTALSGADINNGFMNRLLVVEAPSVSGFVEPKLDQNVVPEPLLERIRYLYEQGDQIGISFLNNPGFEADPNKLQWSDSVKSMYMRFVLEIEDMQRKNPRIAELLSRVAETGLRLATILRAGQVTAWRVQRPDGTMEHARVEVTEADLKWALALSLACYRRMIASADIHMVEPEMKHGGIVHRAKQLVSKSKSGMTFREINRSMQTAKRKDLQEALDGLINMGVLSFEERPAKKGPSTMVYRMPTQH
jgi:hypothetical protein